MPTLLERALQLLNELQWNSYPKCPVCLNLLSKGHSEDCELNNILKEAEKEGLWSTL